MTSRHEQATGTQETSSIRGRGVGPDDPAFPRLHGRPPHGWVNDPNGLSRINGRTHVFFQFNPEQPRHDQIHWGHVSSTDLVTWEPEPVALAPRPGEIDAFGCWSGCVVVDDDVPTAVYSAVADDSGRSAVVLATSKDGLRSWSADVEPVADMPDGDHVTDMRDPFVFTVDNRRFAVQGAGHREAGPCLLVHACDDLATWQPRGTLLGGDDPVAARIAPANVWECPNLIRIDGQWVLIVSLWERLDGHHSLSGVRWMLGDLVVDRAGPRFRPRLGGLLDRGPCFYAPQVLAVDGRVLLWAWSWEHGRHQAEIDRVGWAGCLTFARELAVVDDVVVSRPARELRALRRERLDLVPGRPFTAAAFEVALPAASHVTLHLVEPDEPTGGADPLGRIEVGTWLVADDPVTPPRILVDGSMVEVFDGSPTAFTTRAYPTSTSRWLLEVCPHRPDQFAGELSAWRLGLP